jgi:hypothetical protein
MIIIEYIATDKHLEHHLEKNLKIVTAGMF